jgi:hypothetical protein
MVLNLVISVKPRKSAYREATKMRNRNSRISSKRIIFALSLLVISGCSSQTVKMIQPDTGAVAECSGSSVGFGPLFSESIVDNCARVYENRGYVALQRLTPEQRAILERRGLLPKE